MGLTDPPVTKSKPFAEVLREGEPFVLTGIRTLEVRNTPHGSGTMILLTVKDQPDELSIWGTYLEAQAKSVDSADLGRQYVINRRIVEGFSDRPVKVIEPYQG